MVSGINNYTPATGIAEKSICFKVIFVTTKKSDLFLSYTINFRSEI
jgi:hypothetical protein